MQWSDRWRIALLTYLTRNPEILEIVAKVDTQLLFQVEGDGRMAVLLDALRGYRDRYRTPPPTSESLIAMIDTMIARYPSMDNELERGAVFDWVKKAFMVLPETLSSADSLAFGQKLATQFVADRYFKPRLRDLGASDIDFDALREEVFGVSSGLAEIRADAVPTVAAPLLNAYELVNPLKKIPFGVPVLDSLLRGGMRHSESYLLLGPTGGGKTLMAIQVGIGAAGGDSAVFHATFEQGLWLQADPDDPSAGLRSELVIRALGPLCTLSRKDIDEAGTLYNLPAARRTDLDKFLQSGHAANWIVHDYTTASPVNATMSALVDDVRRAHDKKRIHILVIDPLWQLVLNTALIKGVPNEPSALRAEAQAISDVFNRLCKELAITQIIVHQLGASAASGAMSKLNAYSSAEIRTFAWHLENVIVISRPDEQGNVNLLLAKGRNTGEVGRIVHAKLDGNMNKFMPVGVDESHRLLSGTDDLREETISDRLVTFSHSGVVESEPEPEPEPKPEPDAGKAKKPTAKKQAKRKKKGGRNA